MAQLERVQRPKSKSSSPPTVEQLLRDGEASSWSTARSSSLSNVSPMSGKYYEPGQEYGQQQKKTVLTKVKEKAKKWKRSLSKKRHENNKATSWSGSLDGDHEGNAEYLGAPMYESELAPERCNDEARQHPKADPSISEKHVLAVSVKPSEEEEDKKLPSSAPASKTITENVSKKVAPSLAAGSDTTQTIIANPQGPSVSHSSANSFAPQAEHTSGENEPVWDKGVSVKEYLMHKFEPGEDEKALSQVIVETISPRRKPGDLGMVDKVREAVTSLLRNEDSRTAAPNSTANSSSQIPVSTNAHEVVEEENNGRILQAN